MMQGLVIGNQNISLGSQGQGICLAFLWMVLFTFHYFTTTGFSGTNFQWGPTGGVFPGLILRTFTTDSNISVPILSSIYSVFRY